jgi:putative phosphoesterase
MNKKLPERLVRELKKADAVIHAGDWTKLSVYEELSTFAPTDGVAGNNDGPDIIDRFGYRKILTFEGCRIGVVHGHGIGKRTNTEEKALEAFNGIKLEAVIFGHSHIPVHRFAGSTLVFNPGSPTDKRRQLRYSFGIMEINGGKLTAKHIFYDDKS